MILKDNRFLNESKKIHNSLRNSFIRVDTRLFIACPHFELLCSFFFYFGVLQFPMRNYADCFNALLVVLQP